MKITKIEIDGISYVPTKLNNNELYAICSRCALYEWCTDDFIDVCAEKVGSNEVFIKVS